MTVRAFTPSLNTIQAQASIHITAPPEQVFALYKDVENWGRTFPASIERAQVVEAGGNWEKIEVTHKIEGRVPNTLIFISDSEIGLEESKKRFNASFLNRFEPADGGGTQYVITAYVSLKGMYKIFKPFLSGYVRRQALKQMKNFVLDPLKRAAERKGT